MSITSNSVVSFHYRLREESGAELESSHDAEPMLYLHGHNGILAGLEKALEGRAVGESLSVTLEPAEAYGIRREGREQRIPIKHLQVDAKTQRQLKKGMAVPVQTEQGARTMVIIKVGKFNVDVDTNHPLAGKTLTFDIDIVTVRDATAEEITHKHAHGVGGHQH
ncbi:MAG: FKBP-type peptidyl-prolyl cis-trans isomerase SlyD [Motiliproteus sp.]|jgi:FKBP-type peptidyl-prolyl cis-trans isomerase SlyD